MVRFLCFVLFLGTGHAVAQQYERVTYLVKDGISDQVLLEAGYVKNPALSKLLVDQKIPQRPSENIFSELIGTGAKDDSFFGKSWGRVNVWEGCNEGVGGGEYHSAYLTPTGHAQLSKRLVLDRSDSLKRSEFSKLYAKVGVPRVAFGKRYRSGVVEVNARDFSSTDIAKYLLNFNGVPVTVDFSLNEGCFNTRVEYEDSVVVKRKKSDLMTDLLK
jgi:hypothetical protein